MTMAMDADVRLLIGVARGGADGDSEALIRKELAEIMKNIKATVTVDTKTFGEQLRKELDAISNSGKFYVNLSKIKIGAGAITDFRRQLSAVINTINLDKGTSITLTAEDIGEVKSTLKDAGNAADEAARKVALFKVQMEELGHQRAVVQRGLNGLVDSGVTESERQRVASLVEQYRLWAVSVETVRASKEATSDEYRLSLESEGAAILENINRIYAERQAAAEAAAAEAAAAKSAEAANKGKMATLNEVISAYKKINSYINKNPRIGGTDLERLTLMREELLGVWKASENTANGMAKISKADLRKILSEFAALDDSITASGKKGNTLVGIISSAYKKFGGWMLVTRSLMTMVYAFRQMVTNVRELDAAMTELKKVTDETRETYAQFFNEAAARAKGLGATLTDTIKATADFARLGYSISEAAELADAALVYKNVGDGINDISEASESVISTMKAFGIEAANVMTIVDKFNEVGNRFAISSKGVGDALMRSASALAAAGNSLDESIALVTAANNVVQDPEKVGTTMKTVSMYLRAAKTEAEEAGESTEGMAESVSKLRKEILALTSGRVDIQLDEDTFKSTYQILKELSKVWGDLTDITKANIMEMIGGKRNSNVVASLLNNFADAESVLEVAADSAGSALSENEKYLDSINGKIAQFQAAFEKFSASFIGSGLVKSVVDGGAAILETLTAIIDKLGAFPTLLSTITAAVTVYSGAKRKNLGIFDVVDGKIGISGGITGWSAANKNIAEYNKVLGSSIQTQQIFIKYLDGTDDALAGYLKSLNGGKASMSGYKAYCKRAGVETKAFGASSKAAAIGVTALNTAINMLISLGIGLVIQGIITGITHLINASDEAIEKANELTNAFNEFRQTNSDNIDKLQSLKEEFETLSVGVSRYGENISLTADEYDRYKQIVQTIVDISPALSEGYSIENGYLADKNELIERAIELQEQQYKSELRQMTTTEKLSEVIKGYAASYDKLKNGDIMTTDTDLSNNMWQMFRVNDRDVTPEFVGNSGENKSRYLSEQIMKALGVTDIGKELEKYTNEYGYYQWGDFWDDYADQVSHNIGKIAASIDYAEVGFESLSDFEAAVEKTKNAAVRYGEARDGLEKANQDVADQLKLVAQNNAAYDDLSTEAQNIVSNFIDRFGVDDVTKKNFWGKIVPDEDAITDIKVQINDFIDKLTPEVQNAMSGLFDLKGLFDAGDINVDEFQETVNAIISDLEAAGFDDDTIKYLKLSLETDTVERQLAAVKEAIGGVGGKYDALLGEMSAQELEIAYNIISEEGSMTFEELQEKIEWLKYANADMVNTLDFSDMISGLNSAKDGLDSIISAMDRLNSGTAMTKQQLANLALQYPKLLEQADLFVDGSIDGQRQLLNSVLEMNEAEYDAQLDTKIAELKATEQVINDQLALETEKANIIADIKNLSVNGQVQQEEALLQKMSELNDLQGRNYVDEKNGELTVNEEALNNKLGAEVEYGQQATENVWEPYANTIKGAHTQGFSKSLEATNNYGNSLFSKIRNIASNVWGALSQAVKDATTGNWQGLSHYFQSAVLGGTSIDAGDVTVTFDGANTYVDTDTLDDWISKQEQASAQRIAALEDFKQRTVNAYKNLEALRGLDLTSIYGSAGSSYGSKSDSSSGSSSDGDSDTKGKIKTVEEYIADIDAYYEAEKRLQAAQERANSLAKKLKYVEDPAEKIKLSSDLIDAYKEEMTAEKDLMELKKSTIVSNVGALRALGFEVEYNSETNELYIKNLEHLNELTASSAGEYDTLQEATNALRKETEGLIDVTEQLNDDNIDAASSIEDLGYQVQETKNNIIDYIEEVYKKQIDAYQKIIDLRKEMIESAKDEFDYEADIADKVKEIADLQARIDQLALDDSRSAQAERNTLMQELEEKQKDLADTQRDHSVETQTDALDKMGEDYEADKEAELELLRRTVNSSEELWTAFYQTLLGQSVSVGASIDAEISAAWIRAAEAVRQYSDAVSGVSGVGTVVSNVPKYHDGGVVDEANISKDEVLAILQKGEVVLNEAKQKSLYRIIDFQTELSKRLGVVIGTLPTIPAPVSSIKDTMGGLTQDIIGSAAQSLVFEPHFEVNIAHSGEMADTDAKAYGERIADVAIDKLYSAFERRGINSTRGSRLKP
ncbi:MAG: phage tail tape measure protein [Clostridiales bacterium]|nr:phage tail tape measure protein [Clostridiales bacterium]